jgi:hypothetical protein
VERKLPYLKLTLMKNYLFILVILILSISNCAKGETKIATITTAGTYSFANPSLWLPYGVPVAGDIAIINLDLTINSGIVTVTINHGLNLNNATSKGSLIINNITDASTNPLYSNALIKTVINGAILASNPLQDGLSINNNGTAPFVIYFVSPITTSNMTNTSPVNGGRLSVRIGSNTIVNNMILNNLSTNTRAMQVAGSFHPTVASNAHIQILGNLILQSPTGNLTEFTNSYQSSIYGNVILGSGSASEGHCRIGKATHSSANDQTYNLYGDLILNPGAQIFNDYTVFNFNKAGIQKITNNTAVADIQPEFLKINIGTTNATTLTFDTLGTNPFAYLSNYIATATAGITIGTNSTLDLPRNYTTGTDFSFNILPASPAKSDITMGPNSKLRIGGMKTEAASLALGVFGSNFPYIRDNDPNVALRGTYNLDPTSTIEYYGDCTISQTIHSGVPYAILLVTNPNGSGCKAPKIISNPTTIAKRFEASANTEVIVGASLDILN